MGGLIAGAQGLQAVGLSGKIYSPSGAVLYDPATNGALVNASKLTTYPLTIGTDVPHDTATGAGALAAGGTAVNSTEWGGAANDIASSSKGQYDTTTVGTPALSIGVGVAIAPSTTRVLVAASGIGYNATIDNSVSIYVYRNTTGVPAAGTSVGSDTLVEESEVFSPVANGIMPWNILYLVTGLTAGTTYYFYIALTNNASGGNAQVQGKVIVQSR